MKSTQINFCFTIVLMITGCEQASDKPTLVIEKGKVGVIAYGSLLSLQRTEDVLNHAYKDSIYLVHLEGFQRTWDYVAANDDQGYTAEELDNAGYYLRGNDTLLFNNAIYLNITEHKGSAMNAVLYMVTENEIKDLDGYEFGYERIDVTEKITEYNFKGGKVYAYKATPAYVYDAQKTKGVTVIPQDYLELVTKACDNLGPDFRKEYDATTSPLNLELAAPVIWKKVR